VLSDEDIDSFEGLREGVYAALAPVGALESYLVDRVAKAMCEAVDIE